MCAVKRDGADTAGANTFIRKVLGPAGRKQLRRAASACRRAWLAVGRRAGFTALLTACLFVALAFLVIPILAIFPSRRCATCPDLLSEQVVRDAIVITRETNASPTSLILGFGTPAAYLLATRRFRGRDVVITLVELPLVLPPAVAGVGLLAAFGTVGLIGASSRGAGIVLPFTEAAVVLAIVVRRLAVLPAPGDRGVRERRPDLPTPRARSARRRGGRSRASRCPLAASGLLAGWVLAFARGIGEFGATLIFAGNIQGVTQTLHARDLRAARGELRRGARDGLPAGGAQRGDPALEQDADLVEPSRSRSRSSFGTSASTPS